MKPLIKRFHKSRDREGVDGTRGQINKINWLTVWETVASTSLVLASISMWVETTKGGERSQRRILIFSPGPFGKYVFFEPRTVGLTETLEPLG